MSKVLTYDQIGDQLISGAIIPEEAAILAGNASVGEPEVPWDDYGVEVVETDDGVKVVDSLENCLAYACISPRERHLFMDWVQSYAEGEGHFGMLINKTADIARRRGTEGIRLEVDEDNGKAYRVFTWHGFYELPLANTVGRNAERILMQRNIWDYQGF